MNTYKYRFPASGDPDIQPPFTASLLENKLKDGYDCLMTYCMFPSDSDILDHVSFEIKNDEIMAINLHTYTELYEGMESDLKECVLENLKTVAAEQGVAPDKIIQIEGDVQALGMESAVPKTLYRISQQKNLDAILEKGLIPQQGNRGYKSQGDYVYLTEKQDIVPWLSVLPNLDNPVILEINTEGIKGLEPGRHFTDREYTMPIGYGEYRTKSLVPAENIKKMNLTEEDKEEFTDKMKHQLHRAMENEKAEIGRGIDRLAGMGICHAGDFLNDADINTKAEDILSSKTTLSQNNESKSSTPSAKNIKTYLTDVRRQEQYEKLMDLPDRELCEMVRAHFESHPTMPGEKAVKDTVNRLLKTADNACEGQEFILEDKESIARLYAKTRIRETPFNGPALLNDLNSEQIAKPETTISVHKVDVELQQNGTRTFIMAETISSGVTIIGELPEKFLKNNPMNVESCDAELQIVDYSNGKGKNVSSRIVVDTDIMSGDVIDLDDDMLTSLNKETELNQ